MKQEKEKTKRKPKPTAYKEKNILVVIRDILERR